MKKRKKYQDWRGKAVNFCSRCSNNCLYCYIKDMALTYRWKWANLKNWEDMIVREIDVNKKHKEYGVQVMVPSSHDITPQVLTPALKVLHNLLDAGNKRLLIVTKPHFECIKKICDEFSSEKDKFILRFTIGSLNDEILSYWEPGATKHVERLKCLAHAYDSGFTTSISIEPMLDHANLEDLIDQVSKYVNQTIWLGLMNPKLYFLKQHLGAHFQHRLDEIYANETVEKLAVIYEKFKANPKIRFTGSFREKLKLDLLPPEFLHN